MDNIVTRSTEESPKPTKKGNLEVEYQDGVSYTLA